MDSRDDKTRVALTAGDRLYFGALAAFVRQEVQLRQDLEAVRETVRETAEEGIYRGREFAEEYREELIAAAGVVGLTALDLASRVAVKRMGGN